MRYIISLTLASLLPVAAHAEVPRVVTDIVPVHALVAQVMGDLGAPVLLAEPGSDAHSLQLRPSQALALSKAQLVVWIGPEMTPWLEHALETAPDARRQTLLQVPGTQVQPFAEPHEEHEGETHDDHDDHAHEGTDPHAWLNAQNAALWVQAIAAELAALDPENAATYAANTERAAAEITALDAELLATLAPAAGKPLVTGHDAYGYLAARYGLTLAGAVALGDATATGAASLAALREELEHDGALCLFPEAGHDTRMAQQLVEGTSVRLGAALDPEGMGTEAGPGAYAALMRGMAAAIAGCVAGG